MPTLPAAVPVFVSAAADAPPVDTVRTRADELQRRSRELRMRSAAALRRREAAVHRLELRRELLRSEFAQLRTLLREARAERAGGDGGMQDWLRGEVVEMIAAGWTRAELADVGIGPGLLRELRLDRHPRLSAAPR